MNFFQDSKDWHHGGKDRALLCFECRTHFKKYGELPPVDSSKEPPHFMFKPVRDDEDSSNGAGGGVRTRRQKEPVNFGF